MSFGLLKHFKDLKNGNESKKVSKHYKHLILGQDLGAVLKLIEIRRNHQDETVRLVSTRPINKELLLQNYEFGISDLRSALAVENIYKKHHDAKISVHGQDALFYKDGKFHEFEGRAKPMQLLEGEEFFKNKGYRIQVSSFFTAEEWENLDETLNKHSEIRILEGIAKSEPTDLVDKAEWDLSFKDFEHLTCENLYSSLSPKKFLHFLQNKESFTQELIDVCSSIQIQSALSVTWSLNKEVYNEERTLFIPQSMTHEWGHFLIEFEPYNYQKKEQLCHGMFIVREEEPQSEDLAQKMKLMKRVLDRVFPELEKNISKEYIRFDDEMYISGVKDQLMEQVSFDYPTLSFLGQGSPMPQELTEEKFLARILLN